MKLHCQNNLNKMRNIDMAQLTTYWSSGPEDWLVLTIEIIYLSRELIVYVLFAQLQLKITLVAAHNATSFFCSLDLHTCREIKNNFRFEVLISLSTLSHTMSHLFNNLLVARVTKRNILNIIHSVLL
jgi:hypothetical protein